MSTIILRPVRPASPTGAALNEAASGVHNELGVGGIQLDAAQNRCDNVLLNVCTQVSQVVACGVLARTTTVSTEDGDVVRIVAEGHLSLAVGAQLGQQAVLTDLGQTLREAVRQPIGAGISTFVSFEA